ncbi:MAG: hypothetical protein Dasosvirus6_3 [Dasosvirus sp.]|uniref:Uncharacterized protein n=1 Tax=Dasosvirus sp. TaxID=2487764 RepID=A0A3G4ZU60_9VIRU|nr:MAG: hypothetical protein Dasosvirus6_3 [Dasosvirus sp.]
MREHFRDFGKSHKSSDQICDGIFALSFFGALICGKLSYDELGKASRILFK